MSKSWVLNRDLSSAFLNQNKLEVYPPDYFVNCNDLSCSVDVCSVFGVLNNEILLLYLSNAVSTRTIA